MFLRRLFNLGKKGQALIAAFTIITVLTIVVASLLSSAVNERYISRRNKLSTEAFYLAEGGIESAVFAFRFAIANFQIPSDVESYDVVATYTTFDGTTVTATVTRLEDSDTLILEGQTNILVRSYEIVSTATHPLDNSVSVTLRQIVRRRLIPTFQHMVFSEDTLEVLPGANMNLSGRIHCNKDIYVDAESGRTLTVDSLYFRSGGNIYNKRKDTDTRLAGEVAIRVNKPGAPQYEDMNNLDSDDPDWTLEAIERWKGTVQSAVHGVTSLTAPSVASIQPDGYYATNADVIIVNGVLTKGGATLIEGVHYPPETITSTTTFYNNREGKYIRMTNIDLGLLAGGEIDGEIYPNNLPSNGLLYATRNDAGTSYQPGIKLINGSEISRSGGLTVVSDDPVYIQGNFNTVNEKPAAVFCDSVNLLSNNWQDLRSTLELSSRPAAETTVSCAFIAGIDSTTPGSYNGGLENYPRLHESWSSVRLNIKGSFVALWNSSIAQGAWKYGSPQYTAPLRNWIYNSDFNDVNNLPPFTSWAVEIQRVAWWKE